MSEYSVLIQGPLDRKIAFDNLEEYKKIGPVFISYWDDCDESILSSYDLTDCTLIKKCKPPHVVFLQPTFIYQVYSVYYGLEPITSKYVIRTRSDEKWNLAPLVERFEQNKEKFVFGNIFFRKWNSHQFHVGDHVFIGNTEVIKLAYHRLINNQGLFAGLNTPEMALSFSLMDILNIERTKENFIELVDVMDSNLMKPFYAQFRGWRQVYDNHFEMDNCIKVIDELKK